MKVVLLYETQVHDKSENKLKNITEYLKEILENKDWMNSKSYFHYNGVPVISIFGVHKLSYYEWGDIKGFFGDKVVLIADTTPCQYESSYQDNLAFNGAFAWSLYGSTIKSTEKPSFDMIKKWSKNLNDSTGYWANKKDNRFSFSIIWPGFDDSGVLWGPDGLPRKTDYSTSDFPHDDTSLL